MNRLLERIKDVKNKEAKQPFIEQFLVQILEDKGFRVLGIQVDTDTFILDGYKIEAEYKEEHYSFQAGCRYYSEYYINNLVFLLESIRKDNSILPVHKYAHVKTFDKDMAPYMEGYDSVENLLYPAEDKLHVLLTKMRKDLGEETGYKEKIQLEVSYDPFELEIPDYLFVNVSFGQTITIQLLPLSATFSLSLKGNAIEKLLADWDRIYGLYQSFLSKELYVQSRNYYSVVTQLFELDKEFGSKKMTLNPSFYMENEEIRLNDFIFNVKRAEYSKQFKVSIILGEKEGLATLQLTYMNEEWIEEIPLQELYMYFHSLLVNITEL